MKLLLAEDDRIVRIPVRDALAAAGFQVTECFDGDAALRAAQAEAHDIVLTDVRLPGVDGIEVFRRVRRLHPDMAVLLMTAHADAEDAVAVMREGARDYIVKPFEIEELVLRIGRVRQELEFRRRMEQGGSTVDPPRNPIGGVSAVVRPGRGLGLASSAAAERRGGPRARRQAATRDPVLLARQAGEAPFLDEVRGLGTRFAVVPWVTSVPRGARELGNLVGATEAGARATAEAR